MSNPILCPVILWLDAQLSPLLARWIEETFEVECLPVRDLGLRDAETKRHLKAMIEDGAARYLFPLDADHAHLAIPTEIWQTKYRDLPASELLVQALREPQLVALYHTAEHLTVIDPKTGIELSQDKDCRAKRNVLGFFDADRIRFSRQILMGQGTISSSNMRMSEMFIS